MPRVPAVRREDLPEEHRPIFDELAGNRVIQDGAIHGPFGVMLYSPVPAIRAARLGAYFRYESPLPARIRHLLALVVAREFDCQYEFTVHAELGRGEGLSAEVIAAITDGRLVPGLPQPDAAVYEFVRQLVIRHRVDDVTFTALADQLGLPGVADVVGNVGWLMMISCPLNAFEVEVRPEQTPLLTPRGG